MGQQPDALEASAEALYGHWAAANALALAEVLDTPPHYPDGRWLADARLHTAVYAGGGPDTGPLVALLWRRRGHTVVTTPESVIVDVRPGRLRPEDVVP